MTFDITKFDVNDVNWSSPFVRAKALRNLGLAQLGSLDVIDDKIFSQKISEKIIRILIPMLFRDIFKNDSNCLEAANKCEKEGTYAAANAAVDVAVDVAANAAAYVADDKYLILAADLALETLKELNSPGEQNA